MLVLADDPLGFARLGDGHRHDFLGEKARLLGALPALLAAQGKGVLVGTRYAFFLGHVLGGQGQRIDAVQRFHLRVDQAPADGGVLQLLAAGKGLFGFGHHIR